MTALWICRVPDKEHKQPYWKYRMDIYPHMKKGQKFYVQNIIIGQRTKLAYNWTPTVEESCKQFFHMQHIHFPFPTWCACYLQLHQGTRQRLVLPILVTKLTMLIEIAGVCLASLDTFQNTALNQCHGISNYKMTVTRQWHVKSNRRTVISVWYLWRCYKRAKLAVSWATRSLGLAENCCRCCEKLVAEVRDSSGTQSKRNIHLWKPLLNNGSEDVTVDTTVCLCIKCSNAQYQRT